MDIQIRRTNSADPDFIKLVAELDVDLAVRDGADHSFYAQFNKVDMIRHAVVAYHENEPVACGAMRHFDPDSMEVKRMWTVINRRGLGIASRILAELENWAKELGYRRCVLETGKKQPEAIALYLKSNYTIIPNYGHYAGVENSICFGKKLKS
jgi:putative acetyltransferase